jgi:hypothetical protein
MMWTRISLLIAAITLNSFIPAFAQPNGQGPPDFVFWESSFDNEELNIRITTVVENSPTSQTLGKFKPGESDDLYLINKESDVKIKAIASIRYEFDSILSLEPGPCVSEAIRPAWWPTFPKSEYANHLIVNIYYSIDTDSIKQYVGDSSWTFLFRVHGLHTHTLRHSCCHGYSTTFNPRWPNLSKFTIYPEHLKNCASIKNISPQIKDFSDLHSFYIYDITQFSYGFYDHTDFDSISCQIADPNLMCFMDGCRKNEDGVSGLSFTHPVHTYCGNNSFPCEAKPNLQIPQGFYQDTISGDLVFTPDLEKIYTSGPFYNFL